MDVRGPEDLVMFLDIARGLRAEVAGLWAYNWLLYVLVQGL